MDYIKRFLGLSTNNQEFSKNHHLYNQNDIEQRNRLSSQNDDLRRPNFSVFSDPLQIQQYFEYQINEILKFFGGREFDNGFFSNYLSNFPEEQEELQFNEKESSPKDLRDQFLKNGYEKPSHRYYQKNDKDIDGKIESGDLNSLFDESDSNSYEYTPATFFFGQSRSITTITKSDGSIETHKTVRDKEGNEETTVCRRIGDKEYCISKKIDKYGKEQVTEKLVNTEKNVLGNIDESQGLPINFPFDDFFK